MSDSNDMTDAQRKEFFDSMKFCNTRDRATEDDITRFQTGAVRSADRANVRYDLISPIGLRRLAQRCALGATKYSDFNWEKGIPVHDILNHVIPHIYDHLEGDRSDDNLAAAAWGLFAAMHSEELWPELNEGHLRGPGCVAPVKSDDAT